MTKVLSFWGKGGVGKTTISSAVAVKLAERGYRVLLISTDFVPSLADVLAVNVLPTPVKVADRLYAEQLTEDSIIELWKQRFGEEVYRVASSIFPIGKEVIEYVAGAPGIVEEFTLYYVYERAKADDYDVLVWDTMATGGGVRMVKIQKEFYDHLSDAAKMYLKVKGVIDKIRSGAAEPLELIESWKKLAHNVLEFLKSENHRAFLITRPMLVDYSVALKVIRELSLAGVKLRGVFLNMFDGRREEDAKIEGMLRETMPASLPLFRVPLLEESPRGIEKLRDLLEDQIIREIMRVAGLRDG